MTDEHVLRCCIRRAIVERAAGAATSLFPLTTVCDCAILLWHKTQRIPTLPKRREPRQGVDCKALLRTAERWWSVSADG